MAEPRHLRRYLCELQMEVEGLAPSTFGVRASLAERLSLRLQERQGSTAYLRDQRYAST